MERKIPIKYLLILAIIVSLSAGRLTASGKKKIVILNFYGSKVSNQILNQVQDTIEMSLYNSNYISSIRGGKKGIFVVMEHYELGFLLDQKGMKIRTCKDVSCAIVMGNAIKADVVVMGTVTRSGGKYTIDVKFINVQDQLIEYEQDGDCTKDNIIPTSHTIGKKLSDAIAGLRITVAEIEKSRQDIDLPNNTKKSTENKPITLKPEMVIKIPEKYKMSKALKLVPEKKKTDITSPKTFLSTIWNGGMSAYIQLAYFAPAGVMSTITSPGPGYIAGLTFENLFIRNLSSGIETGYAYFSGNTKHVNYCSMIPLLAIVSYTYKIKRALYVAPHIGYGISYNTMEYDPDAEIRENGPVYKKESAIGLIGKMGVRFRYTLTRDLSLSAGTEYISALEQSNRLHFFILTLGSHYKF